MSYDQKCYDLAEAFLDDTDTQPLNTEANRCQLAQEIQTVIEDFIEMERGKAFLRSEQSVGLVDRAIADCEKAGA